jgi:glutamine amidotransferase-like uncharacterized protein
MKRPKIALFLNDPECSVICCAGMYEALSEVYDIRIFTRHDLNKKTLKKADIIAFPGGIGNSGSFEELLEDRVDTVKEYLAGGGRYLGICMGAYWAGITILIYWMVLKQFSISNDLTPKLNAVMLL